MVLVSWFGNWVGISVFLGFMIAAGNFEGSKNWYSLYLAEHKVHYGWGRVFVKGIFANWLVGIATWMANAAQDLTGKAVAIWWVWQGGGI
jgi:formate/nitrite transporter FocA (FNT family)